MTGYESVMAAILGRLDAAPKNWGLNVQDVRRAHRTAVPRAGVPAVHLIGGADAPAREHRTALCQQREADFTVSLFVRSDAGESAADALRVEAMRRLSPDTAPYAAGVRVTPGAIATDEEIADADAIRVDMQFAFAYPASDWKLAE